MRHRFDGAAIPVDVITGQSDLRAIIKQVVQKYLGRSMGRNAGTAMRCHAEHITEV